MLVDLLKQIYKKILFGYRSSSQSYISYLSRKGVKIGKNVTFYEPNTNYIDIQKPWLVTIGNNVEITRGVVIITHDYAWSVIKQLTGEIIGSRGKVVIGDNVFIGMNTVILQGITVGDNVIIGANSLVNRDIPSNCVAAGNPIKVIGNVKDYIDKRKALYEKEAEELFVAYYERMGHNPPKEIFDEFFWLFEKRELTNLPNIFKAKMELTGNGKQTAEQFMNSESKYEDYDAFVQHCSGLL